MTTGGQIQSRQKFLYGRFSTLMKPAFGSGVVSSFFTFNDEQGFENKWAECDVEFLGKNTNSVDLNVIRTVSGVTDKNINVTHTTLSKRSSDNFWFIEIYWLPNNITWKINGETIRVMNVALSKPQKLMANIWIGNPAWAGVFMNGLLPQEVIYEFMEYSAYERGQFVPKWRDSFHFFDETRWQIGENTLWDTKFTKENAIIRDSKLVLLLK